MSAVAEARCELTELYESQCAHCLGVPDLPTGSGHPHHDEIEAGDFVYGTRITTRFRTTCAICGATLVAGSVAWYLKTPPTLGTVTGRANQESLGLGCYPCAQSDGVPNL